MARPQETGLTYFNLNVDFFDDEKIEAISGEFGIKGEISVVKLLCAIYRNGYFAVWDDLLKMKLLKRLPSVSAELLENIVQRLVKWGFFDKALFDSEKVLTSNGIQKRFEEVAKKRKNGLSGLKYWLRGVSASETPPHPEFPRQKPHKVKESKEKEREDADAPVFSGNEFLPEDPPEYTRPDYAPTYEQALEYFTQQGAPHMTEAFMVENDKTNWTYRDGSHIQNWRAWAGGFIRKAQSKAAKDAEKAAKASKPKGRQPEYVLTDRDKF